MELGEYFNFIWFFLALGVMYASKIFLPEPWASVGAFTGLGIMVGGTVLSGVYAKLVTAEYRHIEAVVRPYWRKMHIYYKRAVSYPLGDGRFLTKVYHGPISTPHPVYGKCEYSYWLHNGEWEKRFRFRQARIFYLGSVVTHAQTDYAVAYEYANKPAFIDKAKPYPLFELIEAGGDYPRLGLFVRKYKPQEWGEEKYLIKVVEEGVMKDILVKKIGDSWFYEDGRRVEEELAKQLNEELREIE